jgi:hypothetical protein
VSSVASEKSWHRNWHRNKSRLSAASSRSGLRCLLYPQKWNLETQVANLNGEERTTGTVNPGVIYVADKFQLGFEAIIPVNRASGDGVGVIGQLHLYLDDIFPNSIGRPLFAAAARPSGQ